MQVQLQKLRNFLFSLLLLAGNQALSQPAYFYDANGNLIKDAGKGIDTIDYNDLNLVKRVVKGNRTIFYDYDALGTRLSKTVKDSTNAPQVHYYADGFEYEDNEDLVFFATEEGRVTPKKPGFNYEYNLKDHLGNTRVSFHKDSFTAKAAIIQANSFYPFGLEQPNNGFVSGRRNDYLYNGKELQQESGFYDYGARMYDPEIARWNGVDPLAEKGQQWSSYNYAFNNPLRFIDPDGNWPMDWERNREDRQLPLDAIKQFPVIHENLMDYFLKETGGKKLMGSAFIKSEGIQAGIEFKSGVGAFVSIGADDTERNIGVLIYDYGTNECTTWQETPGNQKGNTRYSLSLNKSVSKGVPAGAGMNAELNLSHDDHGNADVHNSWGVAELGVGVGSAYYNLGIRSEDKDGIVTNGLRIERGLGGFQAGFIKGARGAFFSQYQFPFRWNYKTPSQVQVPLNPLCLPTSEEENKSISPMPINPIYLTPSGK